jgi:hypothetical protein
MGMITIELVERWVRIDKREGGDLAKFPAASGHAPDSTSIVIIDETSTTSSRFHSTTIDSQA